MTAYPGTSYPFGSLLPSTKLSRVVSIQTITKDRAYVRSTCLKSVLDSSIEWDCMDVATLRLTYIRDAMPDPGRITHMGYLQCPLPFYSVQDYF